MVTEKLYYEDAYLREFDAEVISCSSGENNTFHVVLDRTLSIRKAAVSPET